MCVYVCVCVCVSARACACVRVRVCVGAARAREKAENARSRAVDHNSPPSRHVRGWVVGSRTAPDHEKIRAREAVKEI